LEKAVEAVERLLISTASENWSRRPELQEERRKLLEAVTFYQSFLDQESDDPLLRRQAARAYYRMAGVYMLMNELQKAEDKLKRARDLQEALCKEFPDNPEYKHDLIQTMNFLGNAEVMQGKFPTSENNYEKAVRQAELLVKAFPDNTTFHTTLVQAYISLAHFRSVSKPAVAREYFAKALDVAKDVYQQDSEPYTHRLAYVQAMVSMAQFLVNNDRVAEAGNYLIECKPILEALLGMTAPTANDRDKYDSIAATFALVHGTYLVRTGRQEEGESELIRGVKLVDELVTQRPKAFPYRSLQVNAQQALAHSLSKRKSTDAKVAIERSYRLQDQMIKDMPQMTWIKYNNLSQRSLYLVMRARDGDLNGLEGSFKEVLGNPGILLVGQQGPKYNIACAYAQGSKHQKDPAEKERWAARAVKMLEELYLTRYFIRELEINHLDIDPDLDPLRSRADFKLFMKHFENRPKPTADKGPFLPVIPPTPGKRIPTKIGPPAKAG
jgi:tetratricopeptide (TPR) repeat protein